MKKIAGKKKVRARKCRTHKKKQKNPSPSGNGIFRPDPVVCTDSELNGSARSGMSDRDFYYHYCWS